MSFTFRGTREVVGSQLYLRMDGLGGFLPESCLGVVRGHPSKDDIKVLEEMCTRHVGGLLVEDVDDLSFLASIPNIRSLHIKSEQPVDTTIVSELANLRALWIDNPSRGIDLGKLPKLRILGGNWHNANSGLEDLVYLRRFDMSGYTGSIERLSSLPCLSDVRLSFSSLESIAGIGTITTLRTLELVHLGKLRELGPLVNARVEHLYIDSCKKIESWQEVRHMTQLRCLIIDHCKTIDNIAWIRPLQWLLQLSIMDTRIESNDLSPVLELGMLRHFGCEGRRAYSPSVRSVEKHIAGRL